MDISCSTGILVNDEVRLQYLADIADRQAAKHEGDFMECGVYKGGTALLMAYALFRNKSSNVVHLLDAWEGMPSPGTEDAGTTIPAKFFSDSSEKEVKRLLKNHGLHSYANTRKGWFKDTLPKMRGPFSLVHIDCDLYAAVHECLSHILPRMSPGGLIVIDDYGDTDCRRFPGVQRATAESIADTDWVVTPLGGLRDQSILLSRTK
ncbi:hypothetical protein CO157_00095 [Candidatus Peregrinibacteria bacterium CG_4_9_14_3_um_filter_49_12]|nr:MAG: hypothetical protein CO157_00095 [Candidatus Peregrinibacteria bacterium CG_4_9_14_3_um_filter_49_12]